MKKILLLLLLFTGIVNGQIVNIPDANFKALLLAADFSNNTAKDINDLPTKIDSNSDGEIQNTEAEAISFLQVFAPIDNVTGIEAFININQIYFVGLNITSFSTAGLTNLKNLTLANGQLSSIDVSGTPNIEMLDFTQNLMSDYGFIASLPNLKDIAIRNNSGIVTIDVSNNPNLRSLDTGNCPNLSSINFGSLSNSLEYLIIESCQISSIDITPFINLKELNCANNQLTSLNLSNANNLTSLNYSGNMFSSLDFSGLNNLETLNCSYSYITQTDLEMVTNLKNLYCADTLPILDLSHFTNLETIFCGGNILTTLLIKNGKNESVNIYFDCPNLQFICADESQIVSLQTATATNAPNAVISSYCSFTPGGDYNTASGVIKLDQDNNGCDESDLANPNLKVIINDGTNSSGTFTNANGNYSFYTQTGNFTITPEVENPSYFNFSPPNAVVNFPLLNNATQTQNFCITPNGFHPDLEVVITPIGVARPGFDSYYKIIYKNKGNQILDGIVNLTFDDARTDFVSSVPIADNQQFGSLTWNFNNLHPFETKTIDFILNLNTPLENPSLNNGDILNFITTTSSVIGEGTSYDNTFDLNQTIVNSYDPNDKTCLEGNTITPENVGKYMHYNINFENVGTADAVNIVVKDLIDITKFDINSLQLLYASHVVETKISGNKVEFIFENINLPSSIQNPIGGHGNVLFKIKTLPTLVVGDEVSNTANIFFDYNAPIQTNEARTTIATLSKDNFIKDETITVAPNPTKNRITVAAKNKLKSVLLFDVQGRLLQTVLEDNKTTTLDISNQANGIYFLKVITEVGSNVEKIVKEN
jgi:Leucine-rich repeat (LRR) protein